MQPHAFLLAPGRARGNALGVALALHVEGLLDLLRLHVLDLERVVIRARQQELQGGHPPAPRRAGRRVTGVQRTLHTKSKLSIVRTRPSLSPSFPIALKTQTRTEICW